MRCVTYLFQPHHDPNLTDEEIHDNLLDGAYVLHNYATNTWFELVKNYVDLNKSQTPPSGLVDVLETFLRERYNGRFKKPEDDTGRQNLATFENAQPELQLLLVQTSQFRHICFASEHRIQRGII